MNRQVVKEDIHTAHRHRKDAISQASNIKTTVRCTTQMRNIHAQEIWNNRVVKDVEEKEPWSNIGEVVNWCVSSIENDISIPFKNKNGNSTGFSNTLPEHFFPNRYLYSNAHNSVIHKHQNTNQPKWPITDVWIPRICNVYTQ